MINTFCPRCSEAIRLPSASLPDGVYAECPICRETFLASEVIDRLPPVLQLIGADGNPLQLDHSDSANCEPATAFVDVDAPLDEDAILPTDAPLQTEAAVETDEQDSNPFFDPAAAGTAAVGMAGAAVAGVAGVAAAGAAAVGWDDEAESAEAEEETELDVVEELEEELYEEPESEIEVEEEFDETEYQEADSLGADPELDDGFLEEGMVESGEGEYVDPNKQTVLLDTWQESPENDETNQLGIVNPYEAPGELNVVEDALEEPVEQPGFNEKTSPQTVRGRRRSTKKKSSSIKTVLGFLLGPLIAVPLAGGLLLAVGKAPDIGFYPFDGTYSSTSAARRTAAAVPNDNERNDHASNMQKHSMKNHTMDEHTMEKPSMEKPSMSMPEGHAGMSPSLGSGTAPASMGGLESLPPGAATAESELGFPPGAMGSGSVEQASSLDPNSGEAALMKEKEKDPFNGAISMEMPEPNSGSKTSAPEQEENKTGPPDLADMLLEAGTNDAGAPVGAIPDVPSVQSPPTLSGDADALFGGPSTPAPTPQKLPPVVQDSPNLVASTAMAASAVTTLQDKQAAGAAGKRDIVTAYIAVAKVAEQETSPDSPSVNGLLRDISESTVATVFGGDTAKQWFGVSDSKRPSNGILIIGTTDAVGSTITLPSGHKVSVVSTMGGSLPASSSIIALGKIVDAAAMKVNVTNVVSL